MVPAFTLESASSRVQEWLEDRDEDVLAISPWVVTEFSSALARKERAGDISGDRRAAALAAFARLRANDVRLLPIEQRQFYAAARYADQHVLGLRSGDAFHLAICADHGATLCTLDRRLGAAGPALGIPTILL